jgi:hypothetical protein
MGNEFNPQSSEEELQMANKYIMFNILTIKEI